MRETDQQPKRLLTMQNINLSNITSTLIAAAVLFLFNSINDLGDQVGNLAKSIAVMQEHGMVVEKQTENQLAKIDTIVDSISQLTDRVLKLEWHLDKQIASLQLPQPRTPGERVN